ncbi:MAG: ComEC/Rec2 family competence protein [Coriobacteriia bacterium]|nr:ComEC/Rec2 family competence protein [Coriobacteriia bacterium]
MQDNDIAYPARPHLPFIFVSFLAFWLLLCLQIEAWIKNNMMYLGLVFTLSVLCIVILFVNHKRRAAVLLFSLIVLVLVFVQVFLSIHEQKIAQLQAQAQEDHIVRVISDVKVSEYYQVYVVKELKSGLKLRMFLHKNKPPLYFGELLEVPIRFEAFEDDEWGEIFRRQGLAGTFRPQNVRHLEEDGIKSSIYTLRKNLQDFFTYKHGKADAHQAGLALLLGVVLGDNSLIDKTQIQRDFSKTGLSHLIAVSGSHLVIVNAFFILIIKRLHFSQRIQSLVLLLISFIYVILTGLQISALRSWLMLVPLAFSFIVGRRSHALSALGFSAYCLLVLNPFNALSLSFSLSFLSVVAIVIFSGYISYAVQAITKTKGKLAGFIADVFALSFSSQMISLPLTVSSFHILSLSSFLSNLVISPLVSLLIVGGLLVSFLHFILPSLALIFLDALSYFSYLIVKLVHVLALLPKSYVYLDLPFAVLCLVSLSFFTLLLFFWPKITRKLAHGILAVVLLVIALLFFTPFSFRAHMIVFDVGQGDAIYLESKSSNMLIDTGRGDSIIDSCLKYDISHLDFLALTHFDNDHAGGLGYLSQQVQVDRLILADDARNYYYEKG